MSNSKSSTLVQFRLSDKIHTWLAATAERSGMSASLYTKTLIERLFVKQTNLIIKRNGNGTVTHTAIPMSPSMFSRMRAFCSDATDPYERAVQIPTELCAVLTMHGEMPREEEIEQRAHAISMLLYTLDPSIDPDEVWQRALPRVQPPFFRQRDRQRIAEASKEA